MTSEFSKMIKGDLDSRDISMADMLAMKESHSKPKVDTQDLKRPTTIKRFQEI